MEASAVEARLVCPAKINAVLSVGVPLDSGFHPLVSLMLPILPLDAAGETLEISSNNRANSSLTLEIEGSPELASLMAGDNLLERAYAEFYRTFDFPKQALTLILNKYWPTQGGLGGGSSNAAGLLRYLAQHHHVPLADEGLLAVAASLGSDVPFFLAALPAKATGLGEKLTPLLVHPELPRLSWLLVKPHSLGVPTPWAYRALDAFRREAFVSESSEGLSEKVSALEAFLKAKPASRQSAWHDSFSGHLYNDFAPLLYQHFPLYYRMEAQLRQLGCVATVVCGSGATLAGVWPADVAWAPEHQAMWEHLFPPSDYWTCRAETPWHGAVL